MKIILFLLFITINISAESLSQKEKKWLLDNKEVSFTGDPLWLPYEYFDDEGKYGGIISEYLKMIESKIDLKINTITSKSWEDVLDMSKSKKVSIISGDIADVTLNKLYKPIRPYMINPIVILMNQKNDYVDNYSNIISKKTAIIKGYGYTADIFNKYPNKKFIEKDNIYDAMNALSNGDIEVLLVSELLAKYYIRHMGVENVRIVGHTDIIMKITLFIDKELPELFSIIEKSVASIPENVKSKLVNDWMRAHQHNNSFSLFNTIAIIILAILLLLLATILYKYNAQKKVTVHLKKAQRLGHIGSWEFFMDTGEIIWSDEIFRIFGEEPQSFKPTYDAFLSYIPEEYRSGLENAVDISIEKNEIYEFDHYIVRKDGSKRFIKESGYVKTDAFNTPISMIGTTLDITSIKEAELINIKNIEMSDLLEKFDTNVIASNSNLEGKIVYASKAFSDVCGYSKEELIGSSHNIVRHEDMSKELYEDLWATITTGNTWQGEIKNKRKDGSSYWVKSTISPTYDDLHNIIGYNAIRIDITKDKAFEELNRSLEERIENAISENQEKDHMLAQQNKLASMGEMIGNIAHQWRQPLNTLGLVVQRIELDFKKNKLTPDSMNKLSDKSMDLINQMSNTINDFRNFFMVDKDFELCSVSDIFKNVDLIFGSTLDENNIKLNISYKKDVIVLCIRNELSQVILNIISNAMDQIISSNTNAKEINVKVFQKENNAIIEIEDKAGGIPDTVIEKVFEPYFTTKEEGKGTGIGLYMSKVIIDKHMNGTLSVKNTDSGALFSIVLPTQENVI
ncbi:PAS domain-containing protein [Sulfurimonas sp.]|nr:PAS domain-containing protein [Sulfurimonas sp.]